MTPTNHATVDPVRLVLEQYAKAALEKDVEAFVSLYSADIHVFDMWNQWEMRGLDAWRAMAAGWFTSLGDERVVVSISDFASTFSPDLAVGHATLTYTALSVEGKELRSLDNRITLALRHREGSWKIFHEHTSGPIMHESLKAKIRRNDA